MSEVVHVVCAYCGKEFELTNDLPNLFDLCREGLELWHDRAAFHAHCEECPQCAGVKESEEE